MNERETSKVDKWYSESQYVDVDTGEIITKSEYQQRNLRKLKTSKSYEFKEFKQWNGSITRYGIIKHTIECREHEQYRLF